MKKAFLPLLLLLAGWAQAQIRIDSGFMFQTIPNKEYSLYIPSTYDAQTPNRMMVGFHPLNPARWWAESWCDTLINFAETNGLILVCPDGGTDGAVDDPIDTAFTTALIDSMFQWYNIDQDKVYAMGFSVGGRATYTYGMNHINLFGGFMPIGAAVLGTNEVDPFIQNAAGKPYYIIHGTLDSEGLRFTPIRDALIANSAIVNWNLMTGVGHTIDFPNRNQILTDGFEWLDSVNCAILDSMAIGIETPNTPSLDVHATGSNRLQPSDSWTARIGVPSATELRARIINLTGQTVWSDRWALSAGEHPVAVPIGNWQTGVYLLQLESGSTQSLTRIVVTH